MTGQSGRSSRLHSAAARATQAVLLAVVLAVLVSGCGRSNGQTSSTAPTKTVVHRTHAQLLAAARAKAAAARKRAVAARARAKARAKAAGIARARAKAQAAARAKAAAAAYAAANRWHQGYNLYSGTLAFKWLSNGSFTCADFALNGCWKMEVIAHDGCSYLEVASNEMKNGAIVGQLLANQLNVPPDTPVVFELDADSSDISEASAPTITCT